MNILEFISGNDKPEQFKISKFENNKIIIEFYSNQKNHIQGRQAAMNINSYSARRSAGTLSRDLMNIKYEAMVNWGNYVHANNIKLGYIYLENKSDKIAIKKVKLDKSYFAYNAVDNLIIIYIWGRRYYFNLDHNNNYSTGFIDINTGQPVSNKVNTLKYKSRPNKKEKKQEYAIGYYYKRVKEVPFIKFIEQWINDHNNRKHQYSVDELFKILDNQKYQSINDDGQIYKYSNIRDDLYQSIKEKYI